MYVQYAPNSTFATVQHAQIADSLTSAAPFSSGAPFGLDRYRFHYTPTAAFAGIIMPQPYASFVCELNAIMNENDTRPIQFPDTYMAESYDGGCSYLDCVNNISVTNYTEISRLQIWDQAKLTPAGRMIWVNTSEYPDLCLVQHYGY